MFCTTCGKQVPDDASKCMFCGADLTPENNPNISDKKYTNSENAAGGQQAGPQHGGAQAGTQAGLQHGGAQAGQQAGPQHSGQQTGPQAGPQTGPRYGGPQAGPQYGGPQYGGPQAGPQYGGPQFGQYNAPQYSTSGSNISIEIMKRAFSVIKKKPIKLWALSLLTSFMGILALLLCGVVPILAIAIILVLEAGMAWVYLDGYRGNEISAEQVFEGFKNFFKVFANMGWKDLIVFLWGLIPFVGWIFSIINGYSYSLVPYIARDRINESAIQNAKISKEMTKGYKGKMFLVDLIIGVVIGVVLGILSILIKTCGYTAYDYSYLFYSMSYSSPNALGVFLTIIEVIVLVLVCVFLPLYSGLVKAAWYEEITKKNNR